MDGKQKLHACLGILVVGGYGIYMLSNPTTDGLAFGTVMTLLGLLAGIKIKENLDGDQRGGSSETA